MRRRPLRPRIIVKLQLSISNTFMANEKIDICLIRIGNILNVQGKPLPVSSICPMVNMGKGINYKKGEIHFFDKNARFMQKLVYDQFSRVSPVRIDQRHLLGSVFSKHTEKDLFYIEKFICEFSRGGKRCFIAYPGFSKSIRHLHELQNAFTDYRGFYLDLNLNV